MVEFPEMKEDTSPQYMNTYCVVNKNLTPDMFKLENKS